MAVALNLSGVNSFDAGQQLSPRGDLISPRLVEEFSKGDDSNTYARHFYSEEEKAGLYARNSIPKCECGSVQLLLLPSLV